MGRTNEYQTETSPFDGSQKDAKMAPEKKIFCDIFMDLELTLLKRSYSTVSALCDAHDVRGKPQSTNMVAKIKKGKKFK